MNTEQKVAVVTGASQGVGAALVQAFREAGYRVVANSRSIGPSRDPDVLTVAGDISDPGTAERVVAEAVERFGRVDTLVNNAGVFTSKPFTEFTAGDWAANIGTNLAGFFFVTQHAVRKMEAQGSGHLIQITTSLVDQPLHDIPAVLASLTKGGLDAATKALAIEYARRGVRANAVRAGLHEDPHEPAGSARGPGRPDPAGPHGRDP